MNYMLGNRTVPIWAISMLLDKGNLQLPIFQRDAVWDEDRVELLWDSLLRGIPIGNLIVACSSRGKQKVQNSRYDSGLIDADSGRVANGEVREVLIDGQQRAITIRQGFTEWEEKLSFRLWIDVAPKKERQKHKEHEARYPFFLCTLGFPWGAGISDSQRRECRQQLKKSHFDQIKEEEEDRGKPDYRLSLGYTWPAKAELPIPFATIACWFTEGFTVKEGLEINNCPLAKPLSKDAIRDRVSLLLEDESNCTVASTVRKRWKEGPDRIVTWIFDKQEAICRAINKRVYLELAFEGLEKVEEYDLGEAFNRVNRLGVRLDGNDLFFSALKIQWPEAHDLVWSIYQDQDAGKLLSPPQIVHAAVRLAIADANEEKANIADRINLGLADAHNLLNTESQSNVEKELKDLIKPVQETSSPLRSLFQRLRKMLEYRHHSVSDSDCGLPLPLLARLGERKPHILHNLLLWLHRNPESHSLEEQNRQSMIRYALVDFFFLHLNNEYRRDSFSKCEEGGDLFPDTKLIELASGDNDLRIEGFNGSTLVLASPDEFATYVEDKYDPTNLSDLLLWFQRYYLCTRFPDYDPTLFFNVAALPWDKDHIWPQAKFDGRSVGLANEKLRPVKNDYKWRYLHSFGNLCLLDRRDNRSWRDEYPGRKIEDEYKAKEFFAIEKEVFERFTRLELELNNGMITKQFLEEFKTTINARRVSLYRRLYEDLRLDELDKARD